MKVWPKMRSSFFFRGLGDLVVSRTSLEASMS